MMEQLIEQLKEQWVVFVPIMGVIITAGVAYLVGRPRWYEKLDEQYQKVWAPLHRLMWFTDDPGKLDSEKIQKIQEVLYDNYHLVPQYIIDLWQKKKYQQLSEKVKEDLKYAANRLGYGKSSQAKKVRYFIGILMTFLLSLAGGMLLGHSIVLGILCIILSALIFLGTCL